jgi:protein gp37
MADNTTIEWTDATWNALTGCSVVSPGCTNCYAMKLAGTRLRGHPTRRGLTEMTKAGPVWNGQIRLNERALVEPLGWSRPRMIFACAHSDIFHENVPEAWIDRLFAVMALCERHTFQVLTKRPERMRDYFAGAWRDRVAREAAALAPKIALSPASGYLPNVWLGTSVEDQKAADQRAPVLAQVPAAVRFLSVEPLLGQVDLSPHLSSIDWIIVGGESGPKARPMQAAWVRDLERQCRDAGTAFFFKQWGEWLPVEDGHVMPTDAEIRPGRAAWSVTDADGLNWLRVGKRLSGDLLDGARHHAWPTAFKPRKAA